MVKIKTSPENKTKVTLSDLNSNIIKLTKVIQNSVDAKNTSNSDSKQNNEPSWYYKASKAAWDGSEIKRSSSTAASTAIGGLTGINPVLVQKLGIDKAVGSIFRSIKSDVKKKWLAAGFGASDNKKVNSAVEANRVAPITSRLDKIIKLMGLGKKSGATQKTKENRGFFGKLLSFLGSIAKPLFKIAAFSAILAGIAHMISKIARWFGWKPGDKSTTKANNLTSLAKGTANTLRATKGIAKSAAAKLANKLEKGYEAADAVINDGKNATRATKTASTTKKTAQAATTTKEMGFFRKTAVNTLRSAAKVKASKLVKMPIVDTALTAGIHEGVRLFEDDPVEKEKLRARGINSAAIGAISGGIGAAIGAGGTMGAGALPGYAIGSTAGEILVADPLNAWSDYKIDKKHGRRIKAPENEFLSPIGNATRWGLYTYDQLQNGEDPQKIKDKLKNSWGRVNTDYSKDSQYKIPAMLDMLPNGIVKDMAVRMDHGVGTLLSAVGESVGPGMGYLAHKIKQLEKPSTSITENQNLATDFNAPIQAADGKGDTMNSIEQNTRDTKDAVEMIVKVLQDGNDVMRNWKMGATPTETPNMSPIPNEPTNGIPPFVTLRSIVGTL